MQVASIALYGEQPRFNGKNPFTATGYPGGHIPEGGGDFFAVILHQLIIRDITIISRFPIWSVSVPAFTVIFENPTAHTF